MIQLACQWNLAHGPVRCVVPTLIQEAGPHARPIEDKRAELAALPPERRLTDDDLAAIRAAGDNHGCMALKGATPDHSGEERPDRWGMSDHLSRGRRPLADRARTRSRPARHALSTAIWSSSPSTEPGRFLTPPLRPAVPSRTLIRQTVQSARPRGDAALKVKLVCLEDGITSCGFRKIAAHVARRNADTEALYVTTGRYRGIRKAALFGLGSGGGLEDEQIDEIAQGLIGADLVGFSSMTGYADLTRRISRRRARAAPSTYQIWGGIHPIIQPEDAITADVDAICTGEGEFAFDELYGALQRGPRPDQGQELLVQGPDPTGRGDPQPLPAADDGGRDGGAAVPDLPREGADLQAWQGL